MGGYWRLCPHPLSDKLDLEAMRINLAQGAIAEKAFREDLTKVRTVLEENIPLFYKSLLQRVKPWAEYWKFVGR